MRFKIYRGNCTNQPAKKETPYKYYVWMRWLVDVEIFVRILREKFVSNQINYITFGIWYLLILPLVITFEPMQPSHSQPKQNEIMNIARARTYKLSVFDIREKQFRCWFFRNTSVYFTRRCLICLDFPFKTLSMCKIQIMETVFFSCWFFFM